jgi:hypothetical protein
MSYRERMMNFLIVLLIIIAAIVASLGTFFTAKNWRNISKRRQPRRLKDRYRDNHVPGIVPITLRASRPAPSVHPPTVNVLPTAIVPPQRPIDEASAQQQKAAFQTTAYALPLPNPLVLSHCPRCRVPVKPHDLFCGSCGMRMHRKTPME